MNLIKSIGSAINPLNLIDTVVTGIKDYALENQKQNTLKQKNQQELDALTHKSNLLLAEKKLDLISQSKDIDFNLDIESMKDMKTSYKDEFVLVIFLTPMILAFIPNYSQYALKGFEVISKMPDWYTYIIIGMVVVIYGMRGLLTKSLQIFSNKLKLGK